MVRTGLSPTPIPTPRSPSSFPTYLSKAVPLLLFFLCATVVEYVSFAVCSVLICSYSLLFVTRDGGLCFTYIFIKQISNNCES